MLKIDKEKYFRILETQGLSAAITALHLDYRDLEFTTFEGPEGYQRPLWNFMTELRTFSRELWDSVSQK